MILTEEEAIDRLSSEDNLARELNVLVFGPGNGKSKGAVNLTDEQRKLIGSLGRVTDQESVQEEFGVDQSTVSKSSRGLIHNTFDPSLAEQVKRVDFLKKNAHEAALDVLMDSLIGVSGTMDKSLGADKLSKIASRISGVVRNLEGNDKDTGLGGQKVQVNVFMPPVKSLKEFEVIEG